MAFLIYTNTVSDLMARRIAAMAAELQGICDIHVIGYFADAAQAPAPFGTDPRFHAYDLSRMLGMGYPIKGRFKDLPFRLMPGNTDMPVLAFARDNPRYAQLWLFENDVVFTGPLARLVEAFADSGADLLTTNVTPPPARFPWMHMNVFPPGWPADLPPLRAFLPAFRVSRVFLTEVDRFYREGGNGHYEYSWTYVARAAGLEIEDMGGTGPYVRPGNRNRFYTSASTIGDLYPGSFRFRPPMRRPGLRPLRLYHPVKEGFAPGPITAARMHAKSLLRWLLLPARRR